MKNNFTKLILVLLASLFFSTAFAQYGYLRTIRKMVVKKSGNPDTSLKSEEKKEKIDALADFTIPSFGQGNSVTIIPTPTFNYSEALNNSNDCSLNTSLFLNSLSTDSNFNQLGAKFLNAQTSLFGLKADLDYVFSKPDSKYKIGMSYDFNLLLKKIAFYDTSSKLNTNFNPFVLHNRIGINTSAFNDKLAFSVYYNVLVSVTEKENLNNFYMLGNKDVFAYPEVNGTFMFGINKGDETKQKQFIKIEIQAIIPNDDTKFFYKTKDGAIFYMRAGIISML